MIGLGKKALELFSVIEIEKALNERLSPKKLEELKILLADLDRVTKTGFLI